MSDSSKPESTKAVSSKPASKKRSKRAASKNAVRTTTSAKPASTDVTAADANQPNPSPEQLSASAAAPREKESSVMNNPTPPQSSAPAAPVQPAKSGGGLATGLSVIAILVSLGALGGSAYTWYENNVQRAERNAQLVVGVAEIQGEVKRITDSVARVQAQQSSVVTEPMLTAKMLQESTRVDNALRELDQGQSALTEAMTQINASLQQGVNSYIIDEVGQLLKLANNNVLFAGDIDSAVKALTLADSQLKQLADPRFSVVRQKINQEIGLLNNAEQVDVEQITGELQAMAARIPALKLENERPSLAPVVIEPELTEEEKTTFLGGLREFWADLVNRFDIQRIDQPPKPLLAPEQRYFLNQNLQLQLAKAELAALQGRNTVYQASLQSAEQWLTEYFDMKTPEVQEVLTQLRSMQAQKVRVDLPPVTESYTLLQTIKGGQ
ncbi:heme biosynthesis operon protein HemX [Arenicella chitinivorans]|uniref:Heme biosynthesis operon protein HemX n=1 Tax=Arenicella chitinivorans TaxID=1329800 RepID=A0A918VNE0_9GAMM|nr:uroporphyrinogen-III C-methyltransferase [Arenicella chitinivorans]GHA10003.1 heme biosynthesis operon protein HemX [Arenicella chitinivorans]